MEENNNLSKLSLEPRIGTAPIDVNEQGIEISQPNLESTEKLARQMQKVWGERQFRNLTIESLEASEEDTKKTKVKKEEKSKKAVSDLELMKDTIKTSIVQSYSEINVGIDVLNLILSETRQNFVPTNPLPIPAGIIQHKYHSYTQPNTISQIQNTKLMLGMKPGILSSASGKLKDIVEKERTFWNEAISLRQHHWSLLRTENKQIFVDYGYSEAGSKYHVKSYPQILRTPDEKQIAISLPQKPKKAVKLILQQKSSVQGDSIQENSLPRSEPLLEEAISIPGIKIIENEIFIQIYENVDLTIQWANLDTLEESQSMDEYMSPGLETNNFFNVTISPESSTCTVFKLAMDLLVRRLHRRNLHGQQELNSITRSLRNGGVPLQVHFISNLGSGKDLINEIWKKLGNDNVPLFIGMMIITVDHRHSLRFTLESPETVIIHLPQVDIRTRDLTQFQDILSRELTLLLLKIIYQLLNYLIGLNDLISDNNDGKWILDIATLSIFRELPPILTTKLSASSSMEITTPPSKKKIVNQPGGNIDWNQTYWRRPVKISILNQHPTPDKLSVKVETTWDDDNILEDVLVIGSNDGSNVGEVGKNLRKKFSELIYEFLIKLM
nr:994_t:CDS:10 [Entrophospora candida]